MHEHPEDRTATIEKSDRSELLAVTALAVDINALVDRLEAELSRRRSASRDITRELQELRSRSERLFDAI